MCVCAVCVHCMLELVIVFGRFVRTQKSNSKSVSSYQRSGKNDNNTELISSKAMPFAHDNHTTELVAHNAVQQMEYYDFYSFVSLCARVCVRISSAIQQMSAVAMHYGM